MRKVNGSYTSSAIVPSIKGWAIVTGYNTIIIENEDSYAHGSQVI